MTEMETNNSCYRLDACKRRWMREDMLDIGVRGGCHTINPSSVQQYTTVYMYIHIKRQRDDKEINDLSDLTQIFSSLLPHLPLFYIAFLVDFLPFQTFFLRKLFFFSRDLIRFVRSAAASCYQINSV